MSASTNDRPVKAMLQSLRTALLYNTPLLKILMAGYAVSLIFMVFLTPNRYRSANRQYHFHLIPLDTTLDGLKGPRGQHFWPYWIEYTGNLAGNIILFIPMGFLLSALLPAKSKQQIVWLGIVISISIELLQLLFRIGVCDIDDVILNTIGTCCGVLIGKRMFKI